MIGATLTTKFVQLILLGSEVGFSKGLPQRISRDSGKTHMKNIILNENYQKKILFLILISLVFISSVQYEVQLYESKIHNSKKTRMRKK